MKLKYLTIFLIYTFFSCGQTNTPIESNKTVTNVEEVTVSSKDSVKINKFWFDQNITSATLYCYLPEANRSYNNLILDSNNTLHPTVIDSLIYDLPQDDLEYLKKNILIETDFTEAVSSCFEPHHGLVLRNNKKEIIGHISICFECNYFRLRPENVNYIPMDVFRTICNRAKTPIKRGEILKLYNKQKMKK